MAYLRGMSSAQATLIAHLRSVSMQIKLSFNYGWVRPQVFTLRWICARTPQQSLKKIQVGMLLAPGRGKSRLVTCPGSSCACAHRLCSSCVARQSSPTTEIQTQLCPRKVRRSPRPQAQAEESHRKAQTSLLSRWTSKQES